MPFKKKFNLLCLVLMLLGVTESCASRQGEQCRLKKELISSRHKALKDILKVEPTVEYLELNRRNRQVLQEIAENHESPLCKLDTFRIIDNYETEGATYGGVVCYSDQMLLFDYNLENQTIDFREVDLGNYPKNPRIHKALLQYFLKNGTEISYTEIPMSGRSRNGYCIFSIAIPSENYLSSIAFRQW